MPRCWRTRPNVPGFLVAFAWVVAGIDFHAYKYDEAQGMVQGKCPTTGREGSPERETVGVCVEVC